MTNAEIISPDFVPTTLGAYFANLADKGPWETAEHDLQFRVEQVRNQIRIFFQCTTSNTDWKTNFDFPARPYRDMPHVWLAHRGYIKAYKASSAQIWRRIAEVAKEIGVVESVAIIGYSMGGAYADHMHEDFAFKRKHTLDLPFYDSGFQLSTYTFGAPRHVWGFLTREVKLRFAGVHRYTLRGDPVPKVPPVFLGFRHVGKEHRYGKFRWLPLPEYHELQSYKDVLLELV